MCFKSDTPVKPSGRENLAVFLSAHKACPTHRACSGGLPGPPSRQDTLHIVGLTAGRKERKDLLNKIAASWGLLALVWAE